MRLKLSSLTYLIVNKRLRTNAKDKKIYHGIQELMEEDLEVQEDEDDDEGDNEDPFVDNLIYQIEELRNKVSINSADELLHCFIYFHFLTVHRI